MTYDARIVANYFLDLADRDCVAITPLKLQKLVYLAHGWSLAFRCKPLVRQNIEAWRYGPVIPDLYHAFKRFGGSPITQKVETRENASQLDDDSKRLIDAVWQRYRSLSGVQLSTLTHEPGSAWDLTSREISSRPFSPGIIPDDLIADEFQRRRAQKQ